MTIPSRKTRKERAISNKPKPYTLFLIKTKFRYVPVTGEVTRIIFKDRLEEIVSEKPLRHSGATPTVRVNKQKLTVAAIAWYLHHGYYPHKTPGFINGNKRDFRIGNLRYKY